MQGFLNQTTNQVNYATCVNSADIPDLLQTMITGYMLFLR